VLIDMSHSRAGASHRPARKRRLSTKLQGAPAAALLLTALCAAASSTTPVRACQAGEEACPAVLRMKPGGDTGEATGFVSAEHPRYYFRFDARAGQRATIHVTGGGIKTGPGIPITFPDGKSDALDVDTPFTLPATGTYVIALLANLMSDGPFGRFHITLRIR
jgi:hypothetical protein